MKRYQIICIYDRDLDTENRVVFGLVAENIGEALENADEEARAELEIKRVDNYHITQVSELGTV